MISKLPELTLSDFCEMEVIRTEGVAEIIFTYTDGHPIRLIGFHTDAAKSNFEIAEEALDYYRELLIEINNK